MNNRLIKIVLIATFAILWSCENDEDEITVTPPRDHSVQFPAEEKLIEQFLKEYYPIITYNSNGDVTNIEVKKVQFSTDLSFFSYYHPSNKDPDNNVISFPEETNEQTLSTPTTYPRLFKKDFQHQGTRYSYWYFMVKPGAAMTVPFGHTLATRARPTEHDGVLLDYKGYTLNLGLYDSTTKYALSESPFETTNFPVELRLTGVVRGFSRILPKFGPSSTTTINNDGSVVRQGYGSGIMIFPSGMGYYNNSSTSIPAYSPLMFTFNLYDVKRFDLDQDGVMSYREDKNEDGYFYANFKGEIAHSLNDDSDNDGATDALDYDDDGDGLLTSLEVVDPSTGLPFLDKDFEKLKLQAYNCDGGTVPAFRNINKKRKVSFSSNVPTTTCN